MEKKTVQLPNNETYYYVEAGSGPTILLVHGNMSGGLHYLPLIERLKDQYHVIAPDMRGFGDSTYNNRIDTLDDLADDLILFLDALHIQDIFIAGWSTGGAIALKMAAKYQDRIQKIVLIDSASYRGYPIFKKDASFMPIIGEFYESREELALDPLQVVPAQMAMENKDYATMKSIWDQAIYTVSKPTDKDDYLYLTETLKQRNLVDLDYALTTFNMSSYTNGKTPGDNSIVNVIQPVLSFWGEKDIVVPRYMIDETEKALKNCEIVVLPNAGHSPLVDCPDLLATYIINFFY
ncbi:MAG: alpha/beta hydrolase [Bacilli bacterium]|nr:alpha/beta hydrolase [Bacilli bacterium]